MTRISDVVLDPKGSAGAYRQEPAGDTGQALAHWLSTELDGEHHWQVVAPLLRQRAICAGQTLLRQGENSDGTFYLIESGRFAVTLQDAQGAQHLAILSASNIVGEMALYTFHKRSATVTAQVDSVVWALDRAGLDKLHAQAPMTAMKVHAFIMKTMAGRIEMANARIAALQRGS